MSRASRDRCARRVVAAWTSVDGDPVAVAMTSGEVAALVLLLYALADVAAGEDLAAVAAHVARSLTVRAGLAGLPLAFPG